METERNSYSREEPPNLMAFTLSQRLRKCYLTELDYPPSMPYVEHRTLYKWESTELDQHCLLCQIFAN